MSDFKLDTSGERWLPAVGYEGVYEISDLGRVRSLTRIIQRGGKSVQIQGVLMRLKTNRSGYVYVNVSRDAKGAALLVHRMVAKALLPNPSGLPIVNHLDCDTTHNALGNLEWCSAEQNMRHALENERFGMQRLSVADVLEIRAAFTASLRRADIADAYNIGVRHVWRIGTRRAYTHLVGAQSHAA